VLITLGIIVALTLPHIPAVPAIITLVAVLLVFGLVWYPVSKTLWVAIDRAFMQRLDPGERFDEQTNI
jgi:hypothetical protein